MSMGADDSGDLGVGGIKKQGNGKERLIHAVDLVSSIGSISRETLKITELVAGPHHVVACLDYVDLSGCAGQKLVGWGASRQGQLGTISRAVASPLEIQLDQSRPRIAQIALGNQHTILLHLDGSVTAFGSDRKGQLSIISSVQAVTAIRCTWNGTTVVTANGRALPVLSSGTNEAGQLGRLSGEPGFAPVDLHPDDKLLDRVACGSEHTLAVLGRVGGPGEVWGWGWNEHGNLGTGDTSNVLTPTRLWPRAVGEILVDGDPVAVWAGCGTSWVLVDQKN